MQQKPNKESLIKKEQQTYKKTQAKQKAANNQNAEKLANQGKIQASIEHTPLFRQVKKKPIILFYGYEGPFECEILTKNPENFICFPKPINQRCMKWSGEVKDNKLHLGKHKYPYLFWESSNPQSRGLKPHFRFNGQVMSESVFELLLQMGLSQEESTNFVTFWIHEWTKESSWLIHVADQKEIDEQYPLRISPSPFEVKRFYLYFGKDVGQIDLEPIEIRKWSLTSQKTIIEWGGALYDFTPTQEND